MSIDIEVERAMPFPAERLWRELAAIERHVLWMADAVAIDRDGEGPWGVGSTFIAYTRVGPIGTRDRMRITSWNEGHGIGVAHEGFVRGEGVLAVVADGPDRARVRWSERLRLPGGPLGDLAGWCARPVLAAIWRGNLRRLEDLVARGGPAPRAGS